MSRLSVLALASLVLVLGCSSDHALDPLPPTGNELPCAVDEVFARNCRRCHTMQPRFGAPMPLTSWDALHAPAVTDPSIRVYEMVTRRINSTTRPMPPPTSGIVLSDEDRATLDGWIADMGPPRDTGASCTPPMLDGGVDGSVGVGPDALPCTPSHTITAHATGSTEEGFAVPADADNLYQCFTMRSPFAADAQATAWAPVIDDDRVIHHWILYATNEPQPEGGAQRCSMPGDAQFLMGWAPGGVNGMMPENVGLELPGPEGYLILQVHYWNITGITDAVDSSGVAICTTDTPRPEAAGVMWLGSVAIDIPPRAAGHTVTGTCSSFLTSFFSEPLTILASGPHMHQLGTRFVTEIRRGGDTGPAEMLDVVDPWDFNSQVSYWHEGTMIQPGDALVTTCTYDNPGDTAVQFGEDTEDEMCFNFLTVYPMSAFPTTERRCVSF